MFSRRVLNYWSLAVQSLRSYIISILTAQPRTNDLKHGCKAIYKRVLSFEPRTIRGDSALAYDAWESDIRDLFGENYA
uniref:Uncharacterized protein n=1 Tax=Timema tahoe TaxID=61484 RepID=A0A7R9IRJ2_9NEOP|nr:unnamed protein product [Timema tahoe]